MKFNEIIVDLDLGERMLKVMKRKGVKLSMKLSTKDSINLQPMNATICRKLHWCQVGLKTTFCS
jgi:hypothetical protein